MALISMRQLLDHAAENSYGVPAFNVNNLEQVRAINFPLDDHPRVMAWFERLEARDSTARVRARVQPYVQAMMS